MDEVHYYVEEDGETYIGGFAGADALILVPEGAIEVPMAPDAAWYLWDSQGEIWTETEPPE